MEVSLDLNNEKVLMRKAIKRAKGWAISKLVRCIQNLRKRKGSDAQVAQNKRRTARLVEELDIIKDLKPDKVFKELLDCKLCVQDLMKSDYSLHQRAIVRIGSADFIQKRMREIRENISSFQNVRSGKSLPDTSGQQAQNPALFCGSTPSALSNTESRPDAMNMETSDISFEELNSVDAGVSAAGPKEKFELVENRTEKVGRRLPSERTENSNACSITSDIASYRHEGEEDEFRESGLTDCDKSLKRDAEGSPTAKQIMPSDIPDSVKNEEIIIGTLDDYSVVIPSVYSEQRDVPARVDFNVLAETEGVDDVTEILPNIGADFDSDEAQSSGSDIELEELNSERKRQTLKKKVNNASANEDIFFVGKEGQAKRRFPQTRAKGVERLNDEEYINEVKSCFMESLASVSHQRTKGKNRMSQRARKKLAQKQSEEKGKAPKVERSTETSAKRNENHDRKAPLRADEPKPLHPSWEASRKRKEAENNRQEFQGKRVCFDDSD